MIVPTRMRDVAVFVADSQLGPQGGGIAGAEIGTRFREGLVAAQPSSGAL
jgi:hypothetical protein